VYEGWIRDSALSHAEGVQADSKRRIYLRALVLDKSAQGTVEVGNYTVIKDGEAKEVSRSSEVGDAQFVHFDLVRVDDKGSPQWGANGAVILPATDDSLVAELGYLVEMPPQKVKQGEEWIVRPEGAPAVTYRVLGSDGVTGIRCIAVQTEQATQNWSAEQITLPAWRISTKLWFDPKSQTMVKVDRTLERREPDAPGQIRTRQVTYEQSTNVKYHGTIMQNQHEDFRTAIKAQEDLERALARTDATSDRLLLAVRQDLKFAMQRLYSTPYRPAIERMYKAAESAGDDIEEKEESAVLGRPREARVGLPAPSIVLRSASTGEKLTRKQLHGSVCVMVFIDPASELSLEALRTALRAVDSAGDQAVRVLAVSPTLTKEGEASLRQRVPGTYEICIGPGADSAYGMKGRPHVVVTDSVGVLRVNQQGFGPETYALLSRDLATIPTANVAGAKDKPKSMRR
jgi:hypothetical protein